MIFRVVLLTIAATAYASLGLQYSGDEAAAERSAIRKLLDPPRPTSQTTSRPAHLDEMARDARAQDVLVKRIEDFIRQFPDDQAIDEFQIARLKAIYLASTLRGTGLTRLRLEADRLRSQTLSPALRQAVEYWRLRCQLADLDAKSLSAKQGDEEQCRLKAEFARTYPSAPEASALMIELVEQARDRGNERDVEDWLKLLKRYHRRDVMTTVLLRQQKMQGLIGSVFTPSCRAVNGQVVDWHHLRGRRSIVLYWKSTHEDSESFLTQFATQSSVDTSKKRSVDVGVVISLNNDCSQVQKSLSDRGIECQLVCDGLGWNTPLARDYGVVALPTLLLIDEEGRLRRILALHNARQNVSELVKEATSWLTP